MMRKWRIHLFTFFILSAFGMGFIISSPAYAECTGGPFSFWTLDEDVVGSYSDSIGTNNGAEATFPPTPTTDGLINGAQTFTAASTDQISVADGNDDFDWGAGQSFSIEVKMKGIPGTTGAGPNNEVMIGRYDGASALVWWLGVEGSGEANPGNFYFYLQDSSADGDLVELTPSPALNAADGLWHHVIVVHDADTNTVYLYVDGTQVDVKTSAVFSGDFASTADLNLGWLNVVPNYYFNGTLDEIAIYNRALSSTEVDSVAGARYCVDLDSDGISDGEENAGPNSGDGNEDGTPDMNQNDVVSLLTFGSVTEYVTIETSAGTTLASCEAVDDSPYTGDAPSNTSFPWGFFNFTINGAASAMVTLYLPAGSAPETYYKYGPTTPGASVALYEFTDDGTTGIDPPINNVMTLKFVEGLRGDDIDGDGKIVDPGGPATLTPAPVTPPAAGGGGGGGCFIATAAYGSYMEPQVMTLRSFRDEYLLSNKLGRLFVGAYYKYSPPVANFIAKNKTLKVAARTVLLPLVGVSYVLVNFGPMAAMTMLLLVLALCILPVFIYKRRARNYRPAA